jgi:hypothetical protein
MVKWPVLLYIVNKPIVFLLGIKLNINKKICCNHGCSSRVLIQKKKQLYSKKSGSSQSQFNCLWHFSWHHKAIGCTSARRGVCGCILSCLVWWSAARTARPCIWRHSERGKWATSGLLSIRSAVRYHTRAPKMGQSCIVVGAYSRIGGRRCDALLRRFECLFVYFEINQSCRASPATRGEGEITHCFQAACVSLVCALYAGAGW